MNICKIDGCNRKVAAHGHCESHARRVRLYGDPLHVKQAQLHGLTLEERFSAYTVEKKDGCWKWIGYLDPNGYGRLNIKNVPILAHRISYQLYRGGIPKGMSICHKCDNPFCVNPDHLFLGTQKDNMDDMINKGRDHKRGMKGSEHPRSKLDEEKVKLIRLSSKTDMQLSIEYGVSRSVIYDAKHRNTWKHVK